MSICFQESKREISQPLYEDISLLLAGDRRHDRSFERHPLAGRSLRSQSGAQRGAFGEALNLYAESAVQVYDSEGPGAFEQYSSRSLKEAGTEIELFDVDGKTLTAPTGEEETKIAAEVKQTQQHITHITSLGRLSWGRVVVVPSGRAYIFVTRLRQPYVPRGLPPTGIAISILAAGVISYLLALYLTSPLKKLQAVVQAFAAGKLNVRVSPELGNRKDELADLGREFDDMAERIDRLISSQKRLLGDISHEVRSPLARLTVALELARRNSNGKSNHRPGQD